jgi:hypothetical protein
VVSTPLLRLPLYEGVSKNFRTGRLARELQMVQLFATSCNCIAILWVSLASFAVITLCVASQRVFIVVVVVVVVYFVIDSVLKLLVIPSYVLTIWSISRKQCLVTPVIISDITTKQYSKPSRIAPLSLGKITELPNFKMSLRLKAMTKAPTATQM